MAFRIMFRLLWHEWRQSRTTILWIIAGYVGLATWFGFVLPRKPELEAYLFMLPMVATLLGASMFWSDQSRGQFQFFTEHGVRPRLVWLSRQLVCWFPSIRI